MTMKLGYRHVVDENIIVGRAANADSASKRILEDLVADEERHYDQYDQEIDNMKNFGDKYLALQSIERSKSLSSAPE